MSKIVYAGEGAGLGEVRRNGDRSSPYNYDLTCTCGTYLGVLGQFRANDAGDRTALCPKCKHVTVVDKNAQVKLVTKYQGPAITLVGDGETKEIAS